MITNANFKSYKNDRFVNFFQSIVDMFDANDPNLGNILALMKKITDELKAADEFERRNELTNSIETLDEIRDKDLRGIKSVVKGFILHYRTDKIEAGKRLLQSIHDVDKNIDRLPYVEETNAIRQLTTVWKSNSVYINALDLLGIADWAEHLENTNNDFQAVYLNRVDDEAGKDILPVTRLREPAIEQYVIFVQFLTAYATIEPARYLPMAKQLNELVEQYNR